LTSGVVDLHSHTTASDGTLRPPELVALAVKHGVRVLAITDHDSTDGLAAAMDEAARRPPLTVVPGLEINCDVDGAEIHVLGYLPDWQEPWFQDFLRGQRAERRARVTQIAARLTELGMPIEPSEVFALVGEGSPGRPHVAQVMVNRGYVTSLGEAFERWLGAGKPANVARRRLAPAEAVAVIRRARGVPVLAHPGLAGRDALIPGLVAAGLLGIECWYSEHSTAQTAAYLETCRRWDLVATGGSDYHGPHSGRPNPPGSPRVPTAAWEALQARAAALRAA
jgi:predicted metal-dependent phosphoesterase TrpH